MKALVVLFGLLPLLALPAAAGPTEPELPEDVPMLVEGNTTFALDLYGRLRTKTGNLFYSPYSISTALAMTRTGARDETAVQMDQVLHFCPDPHRFHPAFSELIRELNGRGLPRDYQLAVAQSLWGDTSLLVNPDFEKLLQANYGARLRVADFRRRTEEARRQINRWVEERTNDKIKDLLHKDDVDSSTALVLVNAIYFKAAWLKPFDKSETTEGDFHAPGQAVKVPLMHQTTETGYAEEDGVQVLELPYEGGDLSMVVLLPRDRDGLGKLEQSLTRARLSACLGKLKERRVAVELPRFKLDARFQLAETLRAMGMELAFQPGADFSGISSRERLYLSKVIHQAFVDVNEVGTEAAAATAVTVLRGAPSGKPVVFRADHPFVFLIRHNHTGSILFLGRVNDPTSGLE